MKILLSSLNSKIWEIDGADPSDSNIRFTFCFNVKSELIKEEFYLQKYENLVITFNNFDYKWFLYIQETAKENFKLVIFEILYGKILKIPYN
jgi:Na+-transporting NADH:ubiquinone oxidoreductase subunit NqrF